MLPLAQRICHSVGRIAPQIPCSAFLAAKGMRAEASESNYILINYMLGGGHYEWKQDINSCRWKETVKVLISRLGKRHNLAFLCHNENEYSVAKDLNLGLHIFTPKSPREYFDLATKAKFGICNRMHASVGIAGLGIPSIAICTDTRLLMVSELGLPIHYVKEASADLLEDETECLLQAWRTEQERLFALQSATWDKYLSTIQEALW